MVSLIIPVYNIPQKYLEKCVASIRVQSSNDWQAILVDDGSTAQNAEFCDICANEDARFSVIHQPNRGVSAARNAALKMVHGEWTVFVDADDFIHPDLCKKINQFSCIETEIVFFGYVLISEKERIPSSFPVSAEREELEKLIFDAKATGTGEYAVGTVCGKAYASALIKNNNLQFCQNLKLAEDGLFVLEALQKSSHFALLKEHMYFYVQRESSASAGNPFREDSAEQIRLTAKAFNQMFDGLKSKKELMIYYLNFQLFLCSTYMKQGPFHPSAGLSVWKRWRACKTSLSKDIFWAIYDCDISKLAKTKQRIKAWLIRNGLFEIFWFCRKKR